MDKTNIRAKIEALAALDIERIVSRAGEEVAELAGLDREYAGDRALARQSESGCSWRPPTDEGRLHEVANAEADRKNHHHDPPGGAGHHGTDPRGPSRRRSPCGRAALVPTSSPARRGSGVGIGPPSHRRRERHDLYRHRRVRRQFTGGVFPCGSE